jgi:uncharacterized membrane protein YvbJ
MKQCPVCRTKFADSAEFCPNCKAQLEQIPERAPKTDEKLKIPKSFWITIIAAFLFIIFIVIMSSTMYNAIYN